MIDAAIAAIAEATGVEGKLAQLPGVVGDRRLRRARRGGRHRRGRGPQGDRPRRRDRRGRGVGARVPQRGEQGRAAARARRRSARDRRSGRDDVNLWVNDRARARRTCASATRCRTASTGSRCWSSCCRARVERVLDLGTGDGITLALVLAARPDATGVGLDFGDEMLRRARERFAGDARVEIVAARPRRAAARRSARSTSVVSSFAIHHCAPDAPAGALRRGVRRACGPVDVFVNVEHVASPTVALHDEFLAALGPDARTTTIRRTSSSRVEQHLTWLNDSASWMSTASGSGGSSRLLQAPAVAHESRVEATIPATDPSDPDTGRTRQWRACDECHRFLRVPGSARRRPSELALELADVWVERQLATRRACRVSRSGLAQTSVTAGIHAGRAAS